MTRNQYIPNYVSCPGVTLVQMLKERNSSFAAFAKQLGLPMQEIMDIAIGKAAITRDIAIQFERTLGTPAQFWMQRDQDYQDYLERKYRGVPFWYKTN